MGLCLLGLQLCPLENYRPIYSLANMKVTQLKGATFLGVSGRKCERRELKKWAKAFAFEDATKFHHGLCLVMKNNRGVRFNNAFKFRCCASISEQQTSDYDLSLSSLEGSDLAGPPVTSQSRPPNVQMEVIMLSIPAIAGQAIEPLAQLMETAYVGRLGPLELASAGLSMSIFNIISKVFNIPLLSVATSFVAEDISRNDSESDSDGGHSNNKMSKRKSLPSVSTALLLAIGIGLLEALAMFLGSGIFLNMMGISSASPMRIPAERFLKLRAIGAPAVVLYLAIQGIFRGFKDTKTPVLCLGLGNLSAVFLFPVLMYYFHLGITGAAISTVLSQYIVSFLMIWHLNKRMILSFPSVKSLHFGGYLRSGGFLLGRTLAAVLTITLSTSMAAHHGALAMAAHQICLQVWLSVSLLVDAQAASSQALIASSAAKGDYSRAKEITLCSLKGLLKISAEGAVELLTDEADGVKFKLTDGVDIADDGIVYFTDASCKYYLHDVMWDFLEGKPNGRLLSYDPATKKTKVLLADLYFANGLAISPDQESLIYCETPMSRCKRYFIKGNKKGHTEKFVDMPGMPDNIHYDGGGHFWIASVSEITPFWKVAFRYPVIRKVARIVFKYIVNLRTQKNAGVFVVNLDGKLISHYHDPGLILISSGVKIGTHLYCGSIIYPYIIRLNLAEHPAHATT